MTTVGRSSLAAIAVVVAPAGLLPVAVLGGAYVLWWLSDRLVYVGPLDRATFGWAVVLPMWLAGPIVAGHAWRDLTGRGRALAAFAVGSVIALVGAILFWQSVATPACDYGTIRTAESWVVPSLLLGIVVGGGASGTGLISAQLLRQRRLRDAVVIGAGLGFATMLAAIVIAVGVMGPVCQRPPV